MYSSRFISEHCTLNTAHCTLTPEGVILPSTYHQRTTILPPSYLFNISEATLGAVVSVQWSVFSGSAGVPPAWLVVGSVQYPEAVDRSSLSSRRRAACVPRSALSVLIPQAGRLRTRERETVLRSPLSTLHSPLSTLRSPLSALRSPLSTLHSPTSALHPHTFQTAPCGRRKSIFFRANQIKWLYLHVVAIYGNRPK